ncbi:penicillin-binding protein 2 [Neisseria sp. Ec49-e6-T10]|uniref:penicillin-binding protein 2 n=1 Tax=Neisseria sp. Ec49-e6-T10 TaxID=3140744 RepID=UPI003EC10F7D
MSKTILKKEKSKHNPQQDFLSRIVVAFSLILICFCILAGRFYYLQVIKHQDYITQAETNRISLIPTSPSRGTIVDRNGIVLARNYSAYTLEVTPSEVDKLGDTIERLKAFVDITEGDLKRFKKFKADARSFENIPLKLKLTEEEAAQIAANLYQFPGVEVRSRSFREYPYGPLTAHVLGYIGRISQKDEQQLKETGRYNLYKGSTHIGKIGIESYYENELHGTPGFEEVETDAVGRVVRVLRTTQPQDGDTLKLALDINLQKEVDRLFGNRRGALVAIDPKTGGVLAFVSKPTFDPNLFIDGIDTETWNSLNTDLQTPLINRALRGVYPPGSTFKPFIAMAALETKSLTQSTILPAPGTFSLPGSKHVFRDASRRGHGAVNLSTAIQVSSDTFFYRLGWDMGIDKIHPTLKEFGLGEYTGIDLDNEAKGIRPSKEWKAERYKSKPNEAKWNPADVINVSIGQGYNTYTPLQMANATAILANEGVAFKPHIVQEVINNRTGTVTKIDPQPDRILPFSKSNMDYVKHAMVKVMKPGGTAARLGAGMSYNAGGKTGTAQVVQIKQGSVYNAGALRETHRDHSWFIAFAPENNPQIALAVIVENGGWGASAAGPIARQVLDFYLLPRLRKAASPQTTNQETAQQGASNE